MSFRKASKLVTAPTTEPVTLAELKSWAKIDYNDDDTMLASIIVSARESAEIYMRRAIITQTRSITLDVPRTGYANHLPDGTYELPISSLYSDIPKCIELPYSPIQSIASVVTYNIDNEESPYSDSNYFCDTASGRFVLNDSASWPSGLRDKAAIVITYVCGYGGISSVPNAIKTAILMHAQRMYDERIVCEMPASSENLLRQYRIYGENLR